MPSLPSASLLHSTTPSNHPLSGGGGGVYICVHPSICIITLSQTGHAIVRVPLDFPIMPPPDCLDLQRLVYVQVRR